MGRNEEIRRRNRAEDGKERNRRERQMGVASRAVHPSCPTD